MTERNTGLPDPAELRKPDPGQEPSHTPSRSSPEEILEALAQAERLRRLGYGWQ